MSDTKDSKQTMIDSLAVGEAWSTTSIIAAADVTCDIMKQTRETMHNRIRTNVARAVSRTGGKFRTELFENFSRQNYDQVVTLVVQRVE